MLAAAFSLSLSLALSLQRRNFERSESLERRLDLPSGSSETRLFVLRSVEAFVSKRRLATCRKINFSYAGLPREIREIVMFRDTARRKHFIPRYPPLSRR